MMNILQLKDKKKKKKTATKLDVILSIAADILGR
jgi:hypothetical protein